MLKLESLTGYLKKKWQKNSSCKFDSLVPPTSTDRLADLLAAVWLLLKEKIPKNLFLLGFECFFLNAKIIAKRMYSENFVALLSCTTDVLAAPGILFKASYENS